MLRSSRLALILGFAGALATLPSLSAQKDQEEGGVQEAIRFEKAKQAAADRQARIEEARVNGSQSADRAATEPNAKTAPAHKTKSHVAKKPAPAPQN